MFLLIFLVFNSISVCFWEPELNKDTNAALQIFIALNKQYSQFFFFSAPDFTDFVRATWTLQTIDWLFASLAPLFRSLSIRDLSSTFFCCTVSSSSLKSLHMLMSSWFCSFRWHMTSLRFLLSVRKKSLTRPVCSWNERSMALTSIGEVDSRGVGFRYTSKALDRCDDWNWVGMVERIDSCRLSSLSMDCGWLRAACGRGGERERGVEKKLIFRIELGKGAFWSSRGEYWPRSLAPDTA